MKKKACFSQITNTSALCFLIEGCLMPLIFYLKTLIIEDFQLNTILKYAPEMVSSPSKNFMNTDMIFPRQSISKNATIK